MLEYRVIVKNAYGQTSFKVKVNSYKDVYPKAWATMQVSKIRGSIVKIERTV